MVNGHELSGNTRGAGHASGWMARAFGVTVHPVDGMDHPVEQALPNIHTRAASEERIADKATHAPRRLETSPTAVSATVTGFHTSQTHPASPHGLG
jgi:hypothetical protein